MVRRVASKADGRSTIVRLTKKGEDEFTRIFSSHVDYLKGPFSALTEAELERFAELAKNCARHLHPLPRSGRSCFGAGRLPRRSVCVSRGSNSDFSFRRQVMNKVLIGAAVLASLAAGAAQAQVPADRSVKTGRAR